MSNKSPQDLRKILIEYASINDDELGEDKFNGHFDVEKAIAAITSHMQAGFDDADREGYMRALSDFSGYFMDASNAAQRTPILPDIARELSANYRRPISIKTKDAKF